ncbi:MAG: potassium channel family protein [Candidatus Micrarchaeia archaeon]
MLFAFFAASVLLAFLAIHNLVFALIFGAVNILGATFPPTPKLIDAPNPFAYSSLAIGIIGNVVLTILFTSIFYQLLSNVSIAEWFSNLKIRRMKSPIIITPINGISQELARKFAQNKIGYVLIDSDRRKVRRAIRSGFVALFGDAADASCLKKAKVGESNYAFTLYEEDLRNVFTTLAIKNANSKCSVVSRIKRLEDIPKLEHAGARRIILPEAAVGEELANYIISKY